MNLIRLIILCLLFLSCKTQKETLLKEVNNNLTEHIIESNREKVSQKGTDRYLSNEIKYVTTVLRKDFFEKIDKKNIKKANLIESLNGFSDNNYSAILHIDENIYTYKRYESNESLLFKKISLKEFMNDKINYRAESCILSKMINEDLSELLDDNLTTRFDYTIYITQINGKNNIKTMSLKDICW
ncbi:hypothetical protein U8527_06995 [Kordia algicida OT-1]|uniref:Lipoprotein n=1 Tax=Kordia algicida OT-1 TaxID=391587 RepID=A9E9M8_9FLAO|nr:hypothetical protein [Kordia algicida]EDP94687.1 hypothetical protein KAOT1_00385 [Kordia algicida OT-1]